MIYLDELPGGSGQLTDEQRRLLDGGRVITEEIRELEKDKWDMLFNGNRPEPVEYQFPWMIVAGALIVSLVSFCSGFVVGGLTW